MNSLISLVLSLAAMLAAGPVDPGEELPRDCSAFAESLRQSIDVPGLSFVACNASQEIAWGVAGVRSADGDDPIRREDPFHIGSLSKSMTATVAACLVERGIIGWDATIQSVSPELAAAIPESARSITLRQLLSHRAGLPDDRFSAPMIMKLWSLQGPLSDQRRTASEFILNAPDNKPPGEAWVYSNAGYIIAGHLLEAATGTEWEDLIEEELFHPLKMSSAGQGPPGVDEPDAPLPRGHGRGPEGFNPVPAVIGADNPPVFGPAGRVHCSMADLARYARAHLAGLQGQGGLLPAEAFAVLHADPEGDGYAMGWGISGDADDRRSMHSGSNTRWMALILIHPARDLAIVVGMNAVPDRERQVDVLGAIRSYLKDEGLTLEQP